MINMIQKLKRQVSLESETYPPTTGPITIRLSVSALSLLDTGDLPGPTEDCNTIKTSLQVYTGDLLNGPIENSVVAKARSLGDQISATVPAPLAIFTRIM